MSVAAKAAMFGGGASDQGAGGAAKPGGGDAGYHVLLLDEASKRPMAVSCHAWNKDGTMVAFSPMNNEIHVAEFKDGAFKVVTVLAEHDQRVTAIDWAPQTNRILSCSEDRNAYVWDNDGGKWKPTLVLLRINRAATYARWSVTEKKFAVASGQKSVAVCYYEEENNWWVSKLIDGFESTVLTVAWHNSDLVLAAGSSDCTVRLFVGAVKGVDKKPPQIFGPDVSMKKMGEQICVIKASGWVHDMAFSPNSEVLAFSTHDSAVHFLPVKEGSVPTQESVHTVRQMGLPHVRMLFLNNDSLVCGGHDNNPTLYACKGGKWVEGKKMDEAKAQKSAGGGSARSAAFRKFEMASQQGIEEGGGDTSLPTLHQNCISGLATCTAWGGAESCKKFTSVGLDGRLCFWSTPPLEEMFSALSVQ
mmetsp:Transcript_20366/g.50036  ORF Transcript_20366/g.50036 Transcript_20366/m.50036 type:complete len:417 (-) Transcript_20366:257-1507(-)